MSQEISDLVKNFPKNAPRVDKLTRDNYPTWKIRMKVILNLANEWKPKSTNDKNDAVLAGPKEGETSYQLILLYVDDDNLSYIVDLDCGSKAWIAIQKIYEAQGMTSLIRLLREFFNIEMDGEMQDHL